jgi:hypothetical protein
LPMPDRPILSIAAKARTDRPRSTLVQVEVMKRRIIRAHLGDEAGGNRQGQAQRLRDRTRPKTFA